MLSNRIRPDVEAAPWVIEEIKHLEQQLASLTKGVKIQIPSNTLEQEFSSWHRRGYNKAKDEMHQEVERLKAELAEAKKDAEMFSFVKSRAYVGISHNKECLWVLRGIYEVTYDPVKIHGFDAAILSAMKGK